MSDIKKCDDLVLDISNVLMRAFFVNIGESAETISGLAIHTCMQMIRKYYVLFKPAKIIMAFDGHSWRKDYTASEQCISKRPYKGTRHDNMTPGVMAKYKAFLADMTEFKEVIRDHTTIVSLIDSGVEADDLISAFCQINEGRNITIVTTDSDMFQLLKYDGVSIYSPDTSKYATLEDYNGDPELYLFTKCIRGDRTDNVASAYPRVRSTKIEQAYNDPFACTQLMETKWSDPDGNEFTVKDLYKENQLLIDLAKQPPDIRRRLFITVDEQTNMHRKYSHLHFMRYLGKRDLHKIKNNVDQFVKMLSL